MFENKIEHLGLQKFDRLEPCDSVPDVGAFFDALVVFPTVVLFWRASLETITKHRNPLTRVPGHGYATYAFDALHTLLLGVVQNWCMFVFWSCINGDVWNVGRADDGKQKELSVLRLRAELWEWYQNSDVGLATRLQQLTPKMLGTNKKKRLKTKAAETKSLIGFTTHLCLAHATALGPRAKKMQQASEQLQQHYRIMDERPGVLSKAAAQD